VAGDIRDDTLIVDTSALDAVAIDARSASARVGAGAQWHKVNAAAEPHGLLGASGSAPDVGVSGYTFGGGVGWLTRASGLASNALKAVTYVDGTGALRVASDDAAEQVDREALWAFRGAGGVGLAVELVFDLFPVSDMWAGYALWPAEQLPAVVDAWRAAVTSGDAGVATSLSVLHTQAGPPFPASLQQAAVVHLAAAAPRGPESTAGLRAALADAPTPVVDTWGPADATRLAGIHLDPPPGVPALGIGRWLGSNAPQLATDILAAAAASETVSMVELRNVDTPFPSGTRPGAVTAAPGPFLLHAAGLAPTRKRWPAVLSGLDEVRSLAADADLNRDAASFAEGRPGQADALTAGDRARLARLRSAIDPSGVFHPSRFPTTETDNR
jgi:FAD/FMN-containing dehydrogenase